MSRKLLQFNKVERELPKKKVSNIRRQDFSEIYEAFPSLVAAQQASRCSQCGIPFCQVHCPLENNIPDWLKLSAEGRLQEAYLESAATNNMPEICGRICPQDRLCEGNCVVNANFGALTIGAVEKFLTDTAWKEGWVEPLRPRQEQTQSVGIIGAGPAGMAAAEQLRLAGYQVDVYDRYDRIGGLLVYGIPSFKLEKDIVERRAERLIEGGVRFQLDFEVGVDASLADLRKKHDAVLIAMGTYQARELILGHEDAKNVVPALDYLITSNKTGLGDSVAGFTSGRLDAQDRRVIVIGGGDTAMDCVRTAIRQKAASVTCLYRRDKTNMPGSANEVRHAEEEGVTFEWLATPTGYVIEGNVTGVKAQRMKLGQGGRAGRQVAIPVPGLDFVLPADLVILALGYQADDYCGILAEPSLTTTDWGTIRTDYPALATNLPGVFAAGDCVRGASLVVWAIRDGRDAAAGIIRYLEQLAALQPADGLAREAQ